MCTFDGAPSLTYCSLHAQLPLIPPQISTQTRASRVIRGEVSGEREWAGHRANPPSPDPGCFGCKFAPFRSGFRYPRQRGPHRRVAGYSGLDTKGYVHQITVLKGKKEPASELLPRVHLVISLLKRWLMGTHPGAVSHKHLDYYLDEFTFRFHRRKSASRGKLFYRLVQQAVVVEPSTHDQIVGRIPCKLKKAKPQALVAT